MMTIKQIEVTVGQIAEGYVNNEELGVRGYAGRLDIRPPHQHDPNANNLWTYFQNVINWATTNFDIRKFRRIMKGLDWTHREGKLPDALPRMQPPQRGVVKTQQSF